MRLLWQQLSGDSKQHKSMASGNRKGGVNDAVKRRCSLCSEMFSGWHPAQFDAFCLGIMETALKHTNTLNQDQYKIFYSLK